MDPNHKVVGCIGLEVIGILAECETWLPRTDGGRLSGSDIVTVYFAYFVSFTFLLPISFYFVCNQVSRII